MNKEEIIHLLKSAFSDFKRNKTRTLLTSLGISIGVLSVVLLIALGLGLKNYIKQQFESLGANLILVMPGSGFSGEGGFSSFGPGLVSGIKLDEKDFVSLGRVQDVDYLAPVFFTSTTIEAGGVKKTGYVQGTNEDGFKILNLKMIAGEVFSKGDNQSRAKKAVLGFSIAEKLFQNPKDAVGQTVSIDNIRFKVVGVAEKMGDNEMDNGVVIPYKTSFGSINPDKTFFMIYLGVTDEDKVESVKKNAEEIMLKRYDEDEFSVTEQTEILSSVNQIFSVVNAILLAIGSISLLVGGIGIMNIMYATVTERTKEIGIRRAVGATERDILIQFLTESITLSVLGGLTGLILASLIVLGIRIFFPASINLLSVIVTFGISTGIGVFFGVFPARRAAKLPPIEAIRYE